MHYGYRIVEDMIDGLSAWMDEKGYRSIEDFRGLSLPRMKEWKHLDLNYKIVARIDPAKCIGCDLCYVACWDGAHQCIHHDGSREAPAAREARSRASIAVTPIAKLDSLHAGNGRITHARQAHTRRARRPSRGREPRTWMKKSASAAISARSCAPWRTASPWSRWQQESAVRAGNRERRAGSTASRA